jgi:uncharacterized membrane protein
MARMILWILAGLGLGLIIHVSVILGLPLLAQDDAWARVKTLDALGSFAVLDDIGAGEENPLQLDPEIIYAVCQIDLSAAPGAVSGTLPDAFWSVSVFDASGRAVYGTTNRSGIGRILQLGIFNPAQTKLLATQQLDITEGLLIVESERDDIFVVVRLAPPHPAMRARFRAALSGLECGNA